MPVLPINNWVFVWFRGLVGNGKVRDLTSGVVGGGINSFSLVLLIFVVLLYSSITVLGIDKGYFRNRVF